MKKSHEDQKVMRIQGLASTPDLDRDNEEIVQEGLDISDFVNHGFFNLDHDNSIILGYPDKEKTHITPEGLFVDGYLLDTPKARDIWETAVALQKSNAPRKMGFSVEGEVLNRDKRGKITKAKIMNVAITPTPVNPHATWDAIVKSMTGADTTRCQSLIKQSLEGLRYFTKRLERGDQDAVEVLEHVRKSMNESTDPENVRAYLSLFYGAEGKELDNKTNEVLNLLEHDEESTY